MSATGVPNHLAVINDDYIEWIADMPPEVGSSMARRLAVAEYLGQRDITELLHKFMRSWAARNGKRVAMVQEIARGEEAHQQAAELMAPRRGV